jgi:hypothetical protein
MNNRKLYYYAIAVRVQKQNHKDKNIRTEQWTLEISRKISAKFVTHITCA